MSQFGFHVPHIKGETYRRTFEDRKEAQAEDEAKGIAHRWVQDDPSHCLRWAYGHWEVYVNFKGKKQYVGSSVDQALAVELRSLAIWYKNALLAREKAALRDGQAFSEGMTQDITLEYKARWMALHEKILERNKVLKAEAKALRREAAARECAEAAIAGQGEVDGESDVISQV